MGSRLHGNDGGRRRTPHGRRRRTSHRHSRDGGNPRRGEPAMGSRLHGNDGGRRRRTPHGRRRRAHIVIPATAGIHGVGRQRWVPVSTGTTEAPTSSFPRRRESTAWGACDGFPSTRERRSHGRRRRAHIVIAATAGIHGVGSQRWVPVYTGTTVAPTSSFPRRRESTAWGACDGFPSTRERRWAAAHPTR